MCIFCGYNYSLIMIQYCQVLIFIIFGIVYQVLYCYEDIWFYYDFFLVLCLMYCQVGEQWVSYQYLLVYYVGLWLYDENISCLMEEC